MSRETLPKPALGLFPGMPIDPDAAGAALPDDSRFLASSRVAVGFVEAFGCLPGKRKAESVGELTFLLLEMLRAQYQTGD